MIRFLQRENRLTKGFFVLVIAAASVGMVVYLVPGLVGMGSSTANIYAVIYPHWYSRVFSSGETVTQEQVSQKARQQLQRQNPQYAENPAIVRYFEQQTGQQMVQQQVLAMEADKLGIQATDDDVSRFLHQGQAGEVLFPNGVFIGEDRYAAIIANEHNETVTAFEQDLKQDILLQRLRALITAGVTVSDQEARESYRKENIKIKFDYAVIEADKLRETINPSDGELEAFFRKNAARYATAAPEQRRITYFAVNRDQAPGSIAPPSQQEIQQYFSAHQSEYTTPEQARSRHILISVPEGSDAKTDAAAKAKAEDLLKQIQGGANFAELAKQNSDDPGSKAKGGEIGFVNRDAPMVPEFLNAVFTQKIGETKIVKSQYGYHIIQVEERQSARSQPLIEVEPIIQATLAHQKLAAAEESYAQTLTSEAIKNGLEKTAAAHHLQVETTPLVGARGVIGAVVDSSKILEKAFQSQQGDPPQYASIGEGYAIFQVTFVAPAHAPSFADWKSHVLDDYRSDQTPKLLGEKTTELAAKASSLHDLAKAAEEVGATVKTSDLVDENGQVPDFGQVGRLAPQLFDLAVGNISGAINAGRTGVVAKIVDKQEPSAEEMAKNIGQTREQMLGQRRSQAFEVFLSNLMDDYKKHKLIQFNARAQSPEGPKL
jgi:peptidyl-prolyl cis-trans isomerase D